jgi:hypothetical protein
VAGFCSTLGKGDVVAAPGERCLQPCRNATMKVGAVGRPKFGHCHREALMSRLAALNQQFNKEKGAKNHQVCQTIVQFRVGINVV